MHVSDTLRGGQYLNNWRMAELHAQQAPDRVRLNWRPGAPCSTARPMAASCNATSAGTSYPRLAHVGDRTGLEMIRTLQDHGIHQGIDFLMETTVVRLLKDGDRVAGAFAYDREHVAASMSSRPRPS